MKVALIHQVFPRPADLEALDRTLQQARTEGAELAILPELPLQHWVPATRDVREDDAEAPHGPRHQVLSAAARQAGIALVGGSIVREDTRRLNRGLVYAADGSLLSTYDKVHVPQEEGFWEQDHYDGGTEPPRAFEGLSIRAGLQICSDLFRPQGCHLLGAQGAGLILAPRATDTSNYPRWRDVIRINAATSTAYVISVNRPRPEGSAQIGGPSVVAAPDGTVLHETDEPLTVVSLDPAVVEQARRDYPGYLPVRAGLYARGWNAIDEQS